MRGNLHPRAMASNRYKPSVMNVCRGTPCGRPPQVITSVGAPLVGALRGLLWRPNLDAIVFPCPSAPLRGQKRCSSAPSYLMEELALKSRTKKGVLRGPSPLRGQKKVFSTPPFHWQNQPTCATIHSCLIPGGHPQTAASHKDGAAPTSPLQCLVNFSPTTSLKKASSTPTPGRNPCPSPQTSTPSAPRRSPFSKMPPTFTPSTRPPPSRS